MDEKIQALKDAFQRLLDADAGYEVKRTALDAAKAAAATAQTEFDVVASQFDSAKAEVKTLIDTL